jgi:hypothetical protein
MATYTEIEHSDEIVLVTLAQFKAQLKEVEPTEAHPEDALWQSYLDAALEECEDYINRAIVVRKFKISGKSFAEVIVQSLHTIQSIDLVAYKPENYTSGALQALPTEAYSLQRVDRVENVLEFTEGYTLPTVKQFTHNAVELSITVGLGKVSKKIRQAILLKAAAMDALRADYVKNKTTASENLLQAFKKY